MRIDDRHQSSFRFVPMFFLGTFFLLPIYGLQAETKFYRQGLKVAKILSPVQIIDVKGESVDPRVGVEVMPGSRVSTGNGALCVLAANDGDNMTLDERTEIRILSPDFSKKDEDGSVALAQGRAHFQVRHNPDSPMKVRTAVNMLTVRGTHFSTIYQDNTFRLEVLDGVVEAHFFDDPGKVISTAAGGMLDARGSAKMSGTMTESKKTSMERVKAFGDEAAASVKSDSSEAQQKKEEEKEEEKEKEKVEQEEESNDSMNSLNDMGDLIQEINIQGELKDGGPKAHAIDVKFDVPSGDSVPSGGRVPIDVKFDVPSGTTVGE